MSADEANSGNVKYHNKEETNHRKKRTLKDVINRKFMYIKQIVTVEPLIALYQMAQFLAKPALDNLEFEKSCRVNLHYNDSICQAILSGHHKNLTEQNDQIQVQISNMHSWQQPVQSFMPLVLVLFLGSFSDRHKWRKPFLLLPVLGELFGVVGCTLCVIFMNSSPLELQGIAQKVIPSLFGGQIMLVMASTAYIADVSSVKMRTLRLGIVQIVLSVCSPLVYLFSGVLFVKIGYLGILSMSATMFVIALFYGFFWIREPRVRKKFNRNRIIVDIFDPTHAIDTFKLVFKETPGNNKVYMITVIAMIFIYRSAFDGESNLLYLYTQNVFQWTPVEYSYFITVNGLVHLIGNALGVPISTKILHLSDLMILFITIVNKIITNVIFGIARTVPIFYAGVFVSIITGIYKVAKKSLATKIVSENDIGKAQSLIGICEALAPAVSVPVYNKLYIKMLTIYPAIFFFFSILFYAICCILIIWMYYQENMKEKEATSVKEIDVIETVHM